MKPFLLLIALGMALNGRSQSQKALSTRPNILFIMTDDHAKRAMSAYSTDLMQTPNLDRIANEGMRFTNACVTNAICGPSRAVILTGKFSHSNGFKTNADGFNGSQPTLPKYLQQVGYYTAIIGKWHLHSAPQGFNLYNILIDQGEYYSPQFYNGSDTVVEKGYVTNIITNKTIQLIENQKNKGRPFFIMMHHKAPHRSWMPYTEDLKNQQEKEFTPPTTFFDDYRSRSNAARLQDMRVENLYLGYDLKVYLKNASEETGTGGDKDKTRGKSFPWLYGDLKRMDAAQKELWEQYYMPLTQNFYKNNLRGEALLRWKYNRYMNDYTRTVKSVDDNVGRLLDYLQKTGLDKNTIIIYTSDQGFFLGEHGWYDKRFMYEPTLEMPLAIRYPPLIRAGGVNHQLVQNLDFAPTMLDLAGVAVPADMQGVSLKPLLEGRSAKNWSKSIYYHYYENPGIHFAERHFGVKTDRYKLIYFYDIKQWELYDLKTDPDEVQNLYNDKKYAGTVKTLKKELNRLIAKYKDNTVPQNYGSASSP